MTYLLINSHTNNNNSSTIIAELKQKINDDITSFNVKEIQFVPFLKALESNDEVILVGGDGTLNVFINSLGDYVIKNNIYLYPAGTGNDFIHDVTNSTERILVKLNNFIYNLPTVEINGIQKKFINGVGFGIDGYCCQVGDKLRHTSTKPINYTSIAIKGLLFHFKPVKAIINVDGNEFQYDHVWLAPTMKGRYYGGGMMIAPDQNRNDDNQKLTTIVYKTRSKLKSLAVFPSIFKGEHIKHANIVTVLSGKQIEVTFDHPVALQIDGETYVDILSYKVFA